MAVRLTDYKRTSPQPPGEVATWHRSAKIELLKLNLNGEKGSQNGYYDGFCESGKERLRGLRCGLRRSDRGTAGIQPGRLSTWLGTLPAVTIIRMEARGSARHWGRKALRRRLIHGPEEIADIPGLSSIHYSLRSSLVLVLLDFRSFCGCTEFGKI